MKTINTKNQCIEEIQNYGLDRLKDSIGLDSYGCDLHHELYNMDYFIIGTYEAKKFLESYGVFKAIEAVKDYEEFNFGENYTDYSNPEKLVNMLAYIIGEEFLCKSEVLSNNWDNRLSEETIEEIIEELENL